MPEPSRRDLVEGLRLAVTTFTVLPLRPARIDRRTAGVAMTLAPLIGFALGGVTAGVLYVGRQLWDSHSPNTWLASLVGLTALVAMTGALHLDGLADTVDGLGAHGDREHRLAVMRSPEVGAFGVVAIVLVLVSQLGGISTTMVHGISTIAVLTATVTARLAVTWSCVRGVPAARTAGLGATVAGSVSRVSAVIVTLISIGALVGIGELHDRGGWSEVVRVIAAAAAGLLAAWALRLVAIRRIGGITGDVLGAAVEIVTAVTLLGVALRAPILH
jgi:adenosylcobinamide-GDP ribazoletransferase